MIKTGPSTIAATYASSWIYPSDKRTEQSSYHLKAQLHNVRRMLFNIDIRGGKSFIKKLTSLNLGIAHYFTSIYFLGELNVSQGHN